MVDNKTNNNNDKNFVDISVIRLKANEVILLNLRELLNKKKKTFVYIGCLQKLVKFLIS